MKYVDEEEKVRMLIAERYPFKRVENYLRLSHPEEPDSRIEADTEPEEECILEINLLVMSIDKLNFNTTDNVEDKWFINENPDLAYFLHLLLILYRQALVLT